MADDKHPMDDLLKDFAQQRKEAAGRPEMHPATRRMLQGEVARVYKNEQQTFLGEEPRRSWFLQLWPRLAFGLLTLGFLVFAVVLSQPSEESELAQTDALDTNLNIVELEQLKEKADKDMVLLKRQVDIPQPAAPAAITPEPESRGTREYLSKKEAPAFQRENTPTDAPSGLPAPALTPPGESKQLADPANLSTRAQPLPRQEDRSLTLTPAPAQKPDTKVVQTELQEERNVRSRAAVAEMGSESERSGLAAQGPLTAKVEPLRDAELPTQVQAFNFSQSPLVYRRNFQSPPRQQVLQNFNLLITGNSVTISESAGNTYQGQLNGNKVEASGVDKRSGQTVQITGTLEGLEQQTNIQFRGNAAVGRTIVPIEASSQTRP